jgi:myo-inositol-1-phosphate synthase
MYKLNLYKMSIKVAIVGVGNCASALYQGFSYYKKHKVGGLMREDIGGYKVADIEVVAAFDVDERKVGLHMGDAILQKPNCTPLRVWEEDLEKGPIVQMGHVLDGVAPHMENVNEDEGFKVSKSTPVDVVQVLKDSEADILINYLPVGSQKATEFYAECCLSSGVSLLNCIPVFIASNPEWEKRFIDAGIPLVGDDMKSQFGASIVSQMLQELAYERGHKVKCHIQRNIGGNTDFLNMVDQTRLESKKISKENVIKSQDDIRGVSGDDTFYHAGPSEYISYLGDKKVANFTLELEGFMASPVKFEAKLEVVDSPNSAGVVTDAIRYLKVAREIGLTGSLRGPSAFTQKSPPQQLSFADAVKECDALAKREITKTSYGKRF